MIAVVDIIPDLRPESPSSSATNLATFFVVKTNTKSPDLVALAPVGGRPNSD
jgi:hypothetical protein